MRCDLLVGLLASRLDFADLQQHRAEAALDRLTDLARLEGESGVGDGRIDDLRLRHHADIGIGIFQAAFLGDIGESRALGDFFSRSRGLFRLRENIWRSSRRSGVP